MALIDDASDHTWSSLVARSEAASPPAVTSPAVVHAAPRDPECADAPLVAPPVTLVTEWIDAQGAVEPVAEMNPSAPLPVEPEEPTTVPVEPMATVVPLLPVPEALENEDPSSAPLTAVPMPNVWDGAPPLAPVAPESVPDSVVVIAPILDELATDPLTPMSFQAEAAPTEVAEPTIDPDAAPFEVPEPTTNPDAAPIEVVLPVIVAIDEDPAPVAEPVAERTEPVAEWALPEDVDAVQIEMDAEAFTVEDQTVLADFVEVQVIEDPNVAMPDDATTAETPLATAPLGGPNLAAVRDLNPESTAAQLQLETIVMTGTDTLTAKDRVMIALAVATENCCTYWTHHLSSALEAWMPGAAVDAFVHDWNGTDLHLRERALLAFAVKLCLLPGQMNEQDARLLGSVGFVEADLLDIVDVVAYWGFATRVVDGLGVCLESVPAIESA